MSAGDRDLAATHALGALPPDEEATALEEESGPERRPRIGSGGVPRRRRDTGERDGPRGSAGGPLRRGAEPDRGGASAAGGAPAGRDAAGPTRNGRADGRTAPEPLPPRSETGSLSRSQRVSQWLSRLSRSPSPCRRVRTWAAADARAAVRGTPEFSTVHGDARLYSTSSQDGVLVLDLDDVPPPGSGQALRGVGAQARAAVERWRQWVRLRRPAPACA